MKLGNKMVKNYDKYGNAFHEPPYTEEEQMEMYRRMNSVVSFTRPERQGLSNTNQSQISAPRKPSR
jgi:hypothetical protein